MAEATPLLAPGDKPTTRERSWSQTAEGQRDSVGGARSSLSEAATQTRRRCGCGVVRVCGVALVALAAVGCGVAVALTRHPHAEPHTNSHHPPPPPIIREGFYVDSAEPPGSLRGARMVTVKKLVVSTRDANEVAVAALYQADIANNDTKNQDDVLIAKADDALEAARATLDQAGLDLSAQHRAINVANNTCKNTRQSYYQWVSLCNTPQPPQVCLDDIQPQDAKDAWGAANRSLAEATDALPGLELRRDAAVAELSGATSDSQAMIRKKAADGQTCDLDITNKIGIKNATARLFDAARRACPGYQCRSPEVPPPPPLEIGTEIAVIGTDDGVAFWSLHGVVTDANRLRLTVDFGPALRSGSRWRNGTFVPGGIKWDGERAWTRVAEPNLTLVQPPSPVSPGFLSVGGLYVDKFYHKVSGSPKGLRMVAQGVGNRVDVVGTNDGLDWWSVTGQITSSGQDQGGVSLDLDFSQQENCDAQHDIPGCNYTALYTDNEIIFHATGSTCHTVSQGPWKWEKLDGGKDE